MQLRAEVLRVLKGTGLKFVVREENNRMILTDDSGMKYFPREYSINGEIMVKYVTLPYHRKISLFEFKSIIERRILMKTDADIDNIWKVLEALTMCYGGGSTPIKGDPEKRTVNDLIRQARNKQAQAKCINKEAKNDKDTKKGDNSPA